MKFQLPPRSTVIDGKEVDLDKIRCFRGSFEQLLTHVSEAFSLPGSYCEKRDDGKWYLCTGDWAPLNEVFAAMKDVPLFWIGCWSSSSRGGGHVFTTTRVDGQKHITLSANESIDPIDRNKLLTELKSLSDSQLELLVTHSKYELPNDR